MAFFCFFAAKKCSSVTLCRPFKSSLWKPSEVKGLDVFVLSAVPRSSAGWWDERRSPAESEVSRWTNQLSHTSEPVICLQRSRVAEGAFHRLWACFWNLIFSVFLMQPCFFRTRGWFATGVPRGMVSEQWRGSGVAASVIKYQLKQIRSFGSVKPRSSYFFSSWGRTFVASGISGNSSFWRG